MGVLAGSSMRAVAFGCRPGCTCGPTVRRPAPKLPAGGVFGTRYRGRDDLMWLLRILRVDEEIRSVALKLNLCDYRLGSSGATTSVEFVESVIGALQEHSPSLSRIVLLEHDSSGTRARDLFALLGFEQMARAMGCELFRPQDASWRSSESVSGLTVELPSVIWDVDLVVNLPKLKLHGKTAVTGALKNNFGLVRRRWKLPYHNALCRIIVSVNAAMPRQLVLMDGLVSLSGRGPAFGIPVRADVALASWDPLAVDVAAARLLGVPPGLVGHLRMARRAGLGDWLVPVHWQDEDGLAVRPHLDWLRFLAATALRRG
ncbi:MAG: DUF362 domain-containing protein [Acidimicrobiales bacterium]